MASGGRRGGSAGRRRRWWRRSGWHHRRRSCRRAGSPPPWALDEPSATSPTTAPRSGVARVTRSVHTRPPRPERRVGPPVGKEAQQQDDVAVAGRGGGADHDDGPVGLDGLAAGPLAGPVRAPDEHLPALSEARVEPHRGGRLGRFHRPSARAPAGPGSPRAPGTRRASRPGGPPPDRTAGAVDTNGPTQEIWLIQLKDCPGLRGNTEVTCCAMAIATRRLQDPVAPPAATLRRTRLDPVQPAGPTAGTPTAA